MDKLSILKIKRDKVRDADKRRNIETEWNHLLDVIDLHRNKRDDMPNIEAEYNALCQVNESLWVLEDRIRELIGNNQYDDEFVKVATKIPEMNDIRCKLKKDINIAVGSVIVEEKLYTDNVETK